MDAIPCVDGYPLQPGSPLADAHDALNWYLVRVDEDGWKTATRQVTRQPIRTCESLSALDLPAPVIDK